MMYPRTLTIEKIDQLFLTWNDHINASALFRQTLRKEMRAQGINPHTLRYLVNLATESGYELDEIVAQTNRLDDLQRLVETDAEPRQVNLNARPQLKSLSSEGDQQ